MRILVTGGAGFIGHHLVKRLIDDGDDVVVLDNLARGSFERPELAGATLIRGDIRDPQVCARSVEGCSAVIHLAAQSNVMGSQSDPRRTFTTNVAGTWEAAQAARTAGVGHFIFASSREVYGEPRHLPVRECEPLRPKNLYGATKAAAEALLSAVPAGSPAVSVARFTNVIGSGDSGRVVPTWLEAVAGGRPLTLFGGEQELDFVPVATAVEAIVRILRRGPIDKPVNVGSGQRTSLRTLAAAIMAIAGTGVPVEVVPARHVEVCRFQADVTRMRELLGVDPPEHPLEVLDSLMGLAT